MADEHESTSTAAVVEIVNREGQRLAEAHPCRAEQLEERLVAHGLRGLNQRVHLGPAEDLVAQVALGNLRGVGP